MERSAIGGVSRVFERFSKIGCGHENDSLCPCVEEDIFPQTSIKLLVVTLALLSVLNNDCSRSANLQLFSYTSFAAGERQKNRNFAGVSACRVHAGRRVLYANRGCAYAFCIGWVCSCKWTMPMALFCKNEELRRGASTHVRCLQMENVSVPAPVCRNNTGEIMITRETTTSGRL